MRRKAREYAVQILYALDLNPAPCGRIFESILGIAFSKIRSHYVCNFPCSRDP